MDTSDGACKYEDDFLRWERARRTLRRILWVGPFMVIFGIGYPLMLFKVFGMEMGLELTTGIVIGSAVAYIVAYMVFYRSYVKRRAGRFSRESSIFLAASAAENLSEGNLVRASLFMDKLFSTLSDFLEQKVVTLGTICVAPKDVMVATPETIPRKAVFRAIQAGGDTSDLQEKLRYLATELNGDVETGYITVQEFLFWLNQKSEIYKRDSEASSEKHPIFRYLIRVIGPGIAPLLGILFAELLRRFLTRG